MNLALAKPSLVPIVLLGVMAVLMLGSSWNDSAIVDELAHVPAGYAYVFLLDGRLNPEHPPLLKALAALPLALAGTNFPIDAPSWTDAVNGQWDQGRIFLYQSGNDPALILRLMRLPAMLLTLLLGWLIWRWTKSRFGFGVASLILFFFALSPTFLAHARFVTTDLAAAFGFFIGITAFLRFLDDPSPRNVFLAGLVFGIAQLLKFSLILLLPIYALLLVAWAAAADQTGYRARIRLFVSLAAKTLVIFAVGAVLIWLAYAAISLNYPLERQTRDAESILASFRPRAIAEADLWLIRQPSLRPIGGYLLGVLMVLQRSAGGNTQYFLGEISAVGDHLYFPVLYLLKEPLALHILTLIAMTFGIHRIIRAPRWSYAAVREWTRAHFAEFAGLTFIAAYWLSSISSTLNIGVRHVLPTFPFLYLLVSKEIVGWLRPRGLGTPARWWGVIVRIYRIALVPLPRYFLVAGLILWQAASVLFAFPHYLSYYNILAGGTDQGYLAAVDSNYDWGQDLKRLKRFADREGITRIGVDYFGGGNPRHELGERFYQWNSARGYPPDGGWFAVSATFQMNAYGTPVKGFIRKAEDSYEWLTPFRPVARAGTSIFIYRLPETPPSGLMR